MEPFKLIVLPLVGALIGAFTNQLAIKMLFRPFRERRIGRWRLPFTPGVIPSQRGMIAKNLAATFEANLLSGADIHTLMTGPRARDVLSRRVDAFFTELGWLAVPFHRLKPRVVTAILDGLENVVRDAIADGGELNVAQRIEARLNALDIEQLEELILGFTRRQLRHITLVGGLLGGLIGLVHALLDMLLSMG